MLALRLVCCSDELRNLHRHGQVVDIYPPVVDTPMVQNQDRPAIGRQSKLVKVVTPESIAQHVWDVVQVRVTPARASSSLDHLPVTNHACIAVNAGP